MQVNMNKVAIKILQGSVVTQSQLGGLTIHPQLLISHRVKLLKLVVTRQSYCNSTQAYFFMARPPCRSSAGDTI